MSKDPIQNNENNIPIDTFSLFDPKLSEFYYATFIKIIKKVKDELPAKRAELLQQYLTQYIGSSSLEEIKLASVLSIVKDLITQEWRIKIVKDKVYLAPSKLVNTDNKMYLRQQLQIERNVHLNKPSVIRFIKDLEKFKNFNGQKISIKNLIGSSAFILSSLDKNVDKIIQPYIQIVDKTRCIHTGYKLNEIWRYFRYTWSIPYKSTPGRNIFYLVRDAAQPFHPVIGIAALGNSVLQLTKRDNFIGWTLESIKEKLLPKYKDISCKVNVKGLPGINRNISQRILLETEDDYRSRLKPYSQLILKSSIKYINSAINEIYSKDLLEPEEISNPQLSTLLKLEWILEGVKNNQLDNKTSKNINSLLKDTLSPLYVRKRASELLKLLQAKMDILTFMSEYSNPIEALQKLVTYKGGRTLTTALQANRKTKIGSNIMEIIVCGAIPPYNELLGGKLVSMLMTSPIVISDYNQRYSKQISEIASRMKGEPVVRDSRLAFLGTTSLYHTGSSQYNRIKIPTPNGEIKFKELGATEGFGSISFSDVTTTLLSTLLIEIDGGRKINNVFGEGTSPRMRLVRSGLSNLGLPESFIRHHTKRIIYGIDLASNTKAFLNGFDKDLEYFHSLEEDIEIQTEQIIEFWKERWLINRLKNVNVLERLRTFEKNSTLVSNYIYEKEE